MSHEYTNKKRWLNLQIALFMEKFPDASKKDATIEVMKRTLESRKEDIAGEYFMKWMTFTRKYSTCII